MIISINVVYMSSVGISIASTSLIGKDLGEGKYRNAKVLAYWTITIALISGVIQVMLIVFLHYFIFRFYTNNEEIIEILNTFVIIISVQALSNNVQGSLKGVFNALGKQNIASYILMVSYWIFGGILFYILGFLFDFKLQGLWIGFTMASGVWTILYLLKILTVDWRKEWEIVFKRIEDEIKEYH